LVELSAAPIVGVAVTLFQMAKLRRTQFLAIWPATILLFLLSPFFAQGSVSASSILVVFSFASILAIAALGQTLVVQQGGLDLTVPGVISIAAVLVSKYPGGDSHYILFWIGVAIASGALSGLISGVAIAYFSVTPFVATLAVNALLYGAVLFTTKGTSTQGVPAALADFAVGHIGFVPNLAIVAVIAVAIFEIGIRLTATGRRFVATGESERAARAAGMRVAGVHVATYAVAGAVYASAGVLLAGYLGIPSLLVGNTYLLPTIAAVVLGGTSLHGGAGSVAASAVAALFLVQLQQVTLGMGAPASVQDIVEAAIIAIGMGLRLVPWRLLLNQLRHNPTGGPRFTPQGNQLNV
jgi:ribose transport system permease protein